MRIGQRLYLTVTPAIVGVILTAGLAYWDEQRSMPSFVLILGALAVLSSLVLTWSNARYVARRIERLAGVSTSTASTASTQASASAPAGRRDQIDELDEIEHVVDRLSHAVQSAEAGRADRERLLERRTRDYARLLATVADASAQRLEEVRLPLHILLENHFGELNENQEEMLGAARAAAEAADADMLSLRQIAELDLGELRLQRDRMKPSELIAGLRQMMLAAAAEAGVSVEFEIAPLLPALVGDRERLQDALVTLIRGAIASAAPESRVRVVADGSAEMIHLSVIGGGAPPPSVQWAAAVRVVHAHGGVVERRDDGLWLELPSERRSTTMSGTDGGEERAGRA